MRGCTARRSVFDACGQASAVTRVSAFEDPREGEPRLGWRRVSSAGGSSVPGHPHRRAQELRTLLGACGLEVAGANGFQACSAIALLCAGVDLGRRAVRSFLCMQVSFLLKGVTYSVYSICQLPKGDLRLLVLISRFS